ncbi:tyrosine-type recombinase/integrase [Fluviicola sp.]|jgi:site-specific recombinase XerD|uniref:tyrosine-type recombinase/integrase n=1 Tax=Fluviicola sp. TaxID=1917219 RepID=UPI00281FB72D|nr:tyrosine-type recombinase/integrase [Fluviicola sp.]MDR0801371.1 site-specific integrase [Fluviicola sp.]
MSFHPKNYQFSVGEHQDKNVIWVQFPYGECLKNELKEKFPTAKWSASKKCWYLPDVGSIRKEIGLPEKTESGKAVIAKIHSVNLAALQKMHELLLLKSYSPNTIRTYCQEFSQLLSQLKNTNVDTLTPERLRSYFLYCTTKLKFSETLIHSRMNAIKFYFEQVLKREKFFFEEIPRPKKKSSLPKAFGKNDISKLFSTIENPKHLLMLKLCYGMGLRVSEIVNLKITNIDSGRMLVHIENAKGKKDRYVTLPSSVLEDLRNYYKVYRPKEFLFEGQYGGQYAIRSVQAVFKTAMQKAKINKAVGIHGLRHSYATHLLEAGTDMVFIQKLLGQRDLKTTEIYAKVSNRQLSQVKSPLDDLS